MLDSSVRPTQHGITPTLGAPCNQTGYDSFKKIYSTDLSGAFAALTIIVSLLLPRRLCVHVSIGAAAGGCYSVIQKLLSEDLRLNVLVGTRDPSYPHCRVAWPPSAVHGKCVSSLSSVCVCGLSLGRRPTEPINCTGRS